MSWLIYCSREKSKHPSNWMMFAMSTYLAGDHHKAIEILDKVEPQLRFVPENQYVQALHNVGFHSVLAKHKLWSLTKDPSILDQAFRSWHVYLNGSVITTPLSDPDNTYKKNAEIYFKQAKALIDNMKTETL